MASGTTALHVFGDTFRRLVETATAGAVTIRIFPSGTLGQEREVVQQLQEGLVDFMVSGTAIWGSVAPKLQVFDFPFLWRDWDHVHTVVDGSVGREAADYLERTVRVRPFAWGDSFGFRHVITRSRDISEPGQLAGLKIRTIQSPIYVKAVELMGASPTPMAFGEVYTSLQTGVIDGYEHDASTTFLRDRRLHGSHATHRGRPWALDVGGDAGAGVSGRSRHPRAGCARRSACPTRDGTERGRWRHRTTDGTRDEDSRHRRSSAQTGCRALVGTGGPCARRDILARGHPRVNPPLPFAASRFDRILQWSVAMLVGAQALVVGLQVVGRLLMHRPIPWTEEIARLLLIWLMCAGGVLALGHSQHPRVTAFVRLLSADRRAAVDRGLRFVLLVFFLLLVMPATRLTFASLGERLPASGISGAWMSAGLPVALLLMCVVIAQQFWREGLEVWRDRSLFAWSFGASGVVLASVLIPLVAGAAPLVVLVTGFLATAALGMPLAFTLALTSLTYLLGIGGVSLIILPIKILGGVDSFVLLAIPLFILAGALMESGGISERIVALAMALVGRVRGGLAMVAVVAEILFSGISGSTAADVSAISSLLIPSMRKAGYSGPESVSIVASASAMGILVPPCLTMVVLGSLVNLSIVTLFLAGFVPAFILASALLVSIAVRARRHAWPVSGKSSNADLLRAARRAALPLGLPTILFGGIFTGATTVTEAALIAVGYALMAGSVMGGLNRRELVGQLAQSGIVTATTLWVLAAASAFAWILVREWVPQMLGDWISSAGAGRTGVLALTVVVFVLIGALLEGPRRRSGSSALRDRHRRGHGHCVLPAAGRRRPVDRRGSRARRHRRRDPQLRAVSRGAPRRPRPDRRLSVVHANPPSPVSGLWLSSGTLNRDSHG
jgi:tripartite ATP-independent transporter DctM subunit/tripartite ATP-independent transporter DctP family solute receptor